jgi:RNA polymerase sigma-70 factor (ECF subfamily)
MCNQIGPTSHNQRVSVQAAQLADLMLVDRCKEGQEAASRELFRLYQRRVHAALYRILGSNRDIDDLMQEAFIQVFRSLHTYRGDSRLATWIDRVTVRVAFRYLRDKKRVPMPLAEIDDESRGPRPSEQAAAREGVRRLYELLSELPPSSRVAFALHELDGRSIAEVAEIVGSAKSATKLRIWRARKQLFKRAENDPYLAELLSGIEEGASK